MASAEIRLRPMGLADLLGETIRIVRRRFWFLFILVAIAFIPAAVVGLISTLVAAVIGVDLLAFLGSIVQTLVSNLAVGAAIIAISDVCLGRRPSILRSYALLRRRI